MRTIYRFWCTRLNPHVHGAILAKSSCWLTTAHHCKTLLNGSLKVPINFLSWRFHDVFKGKKCKYVTLSSVSKMQEKSEKKENQSYILNFGRHPFSGPSDSHWKTEHIPLLERVLCSFVFLLSFLLSVSACLLFVGSVLLSFQLTRCWPGRFQRGSEGRASRLATGSLWLGPVTPLPGSWPRFYETRGQLG